jgi:hypothetical protein
VGTSIAVQQKLMRHADIRTTMNTYRDIVTDAMTVASGKVKRLALHGTENGTEGWLSALFGGSECESNAPATGNLPPAGFEDRELHRQPLASSISYEGPRSGLTTVPGIYHIEIVREL